VIDQRVNGPKPPGFCLLVVVVALSGCAQDNVSDLTAFVQQEKSKKTGRIEPLPEIQVYETHSYSAADLRSPFVAAVSKGEEQQEVAATNGISPNFDRPRELLEEYPLDSLRMVGTLEQTQKVWAIVQATDGTIHRVVSGNYLGQNHGKILSISENGIEIVEIVPDGQGGWQEREAAIALGGEL